MTVGCWCRNWSMPQPFCAPYEDSRASHTVAACYLSKHLVSSSEQKSFCRIPPSCFKLYSRAVRSKGMDGYLSICPSIHHLIVLYWHTYSLTYTSQSIESPMDLNMLNRILECGGNHSTLGKTYTVQRQGEHANSTQKDPVRQHLIHCDPRPLHHNPPSFNSDRQCNDCNIKYSTSI